MIKKLEIGRVDSTLNKADDNEPLFILRAQDCLAVRTVEFWIAEARALGVDLKKIDRARNWVTHAKDWQRRKLPD